MFSILMTSLTDETLDIAMGTLTQIVARPLRVNNHLYLTP